MSRWPDAAALTLLLLLVLVTTYENLRGTALRYRIARAEIEAIRAERWVETRRSELRRAANAASTWRAALALGVSPLPDPGREEPPAPALAFGGEE